jgi:hypothetical protein
MNARLAALLAVPESDAEMLPSELDSAPNEMAVDTTFAPGWRLLDAGSGWKPSPIGVYAK